ncbi:MAG: glycerophosphodiester phosphodiesterase [Candidatus Saccharimonas sp.]
MLIIGHRGAAGLAPENTMKALKAGYEADADMLEIDVRMTKDGRIVAVHDSRLTRTHHHREAVAGITYDQFKTLTKDNPVPLLETILDKYFGHILLNIEVKSRDCGEAVLELLKTHYIKKTSEWDNVIISSFKGTELSRIRKLAPKANLALLHNENPFLFIAYQRKLKLTAVGFHRLYLNPLALQIAKKAGLFIYVYTVDRIGALSFLEEQGVDGIVTNYPDKFVTALKNPKTK